MCSCSALEPTSCVENEQTEPCMQSMLCFDRAEYMNVLSEGALRDVQHERHRVTLPRLQGHRLSRRSGLIRRRGPPVAAGLVARDAGIVEQRESVRPRGQHARVEQECLLRDGGACAGRAYIGDGQLPEEQLLSFLCVACKGWGHKGVDVQDIGMAGNALWDSAPRAAQSTGA